MRSVLKIELSETATEADLDVIEKGLVDFNKDLIGASNRQTLVVMVRDENDQVVGGLLGATARGWLYIDSVFVPENLRGQGVAQTMVELAEVEARKRGCHGAWLDTVNPDAFRIYQRCGYAVFGTLDNFANGQAFSFMSKML